MDHERWSQKYFVSVTRGAPSFFACSRRFDLIKIKNLVALPRVAQKFLFYFLLKIKSTTAKCVLNFGHPVPADSTLTKTA